MLLLFPLASLSQTVHVEGEEIVYQGVLQAPMVEEPEARLRGEQALASTLKGLGEVTTMDLPKKGVTARASLKLTTPYHLIRILHYTIELTENDSGYTYRIDSVSLQERVRGEKAMVRSSKELLEALSESGKGAIEAEKLLNETDMRLQQILAVLRNRLNAPSRKKN